MTTSIADLENGTTIDDGVTGDHGNVLSCSWAERGPNWTEAKETLSYGLDVHIYIFAACFAVIFFYALYAVIRIFRQHHVRKRLGVSLHVMIALTSFTRSLSLFMDPYGSRGFIPCPFNVIIWSFGWPGVVSSYSIFFLAVLETTNLSIVSPRFQRFSILLVIIAISLGYVLFSDLLVSFIPNSILAIIVCEIMFIIWGLCLTVGFVYVWWKVRKNLSASCPRNARERRRSSVNGSVVAAAEREKRRLNRLIMVLIFSALICLILTSSHVEPIIDAFHWSIIDFLAKPWQWIIYQTGQRILEISMCVLIMVAMSKSSQSHNRKASEKVKIVEGIARENGLKNGLENQALDSQMELPRTCNKKVYKS